MTNRSQGLAVSQVILGVRCWRTQLPESPASSVASWIHSEEHGWLLGCCGFSSWQGEADSKPTPHPSPSPECPSLDRGGLRAAAPVVSGTGQEQVWPVSRLMEEIRRPSDGGLLVSSTRSSDCLKALSDKGPCPPFVP